MEHRIGFGPRLGAYLIDFIFVLGIAFILSSVVSDFLMNFVDTSAISDQQWDQMQKLYGGFAGVILTLSVSAPLAAFLYGLIEGFTGASPGKMMVGIKIGNQDGTPAEVGKLMIRFAIKNSGNIISLIYIAVSIIALKYLSSIVGVVILIGCFFVLGDNKLALHDIIAKTAVYKRAFLNGTEHPAEVE